MDAIIFLPPVGKSFEKSRASRSRPSKHNFKRKASVEQTIVTKILTDHFSRFNYALKPVNDVTDRRMDHALDGPYDRGGVQK